ncbi:PAS domain S-box protein [Aquiflexum sp.]|uniref:PAS domain S-box protein n=1 Tax=Aquiflexum sp. TaxID=1872584 RepID=UPI003593EEBF
MRKDIKEYKILIVEDNVGDFMLVEEYLDETILSPNIIRCENFKQAKEELLRDYKNLDVILLDLSLPDKSGETLINEVLEISGDLPIIVLTGFTDANFAVKSLSMGISDYLLKDDLSPTTLYKSIVYNIERNKNLVKLLESEQKYADLFHLSPQPMWVYDSETLKFLNVNQAAINHYGYSFDEFMEMTISEIRPNEDIPNMLETLEKIRTENIGIYRGFLNHKKRDGSIIRVEVISNPLSFEERNSWLVLANDITSKLKYLEAIETQNEKLRDIAWIQSHMVRAPLARLLGLVEILKNEKLSSLELDDFLDHIKESAKELDNVVRDIVEKAQKIDVNKN